MSDTSRTPKKPAAKKAREMPRAKALQCTAFLRHLRKTGNVAIAADAVGVNPTTLWCRRRHHPDFAAGWDAALVFARAKLADGPKVATSADTIRTQGGEYHVRVNRHGHRQICRSAPGRLSTAGEQAFLAALATTANMKMAAQSVGIAISAIYERRSRSPAFEREVKEALRIGYETVELALVDYVVNGLDDEGGDPQAWMAVLDDPTDHPLKRMSPLDAINQLNLHKAGVVDGRATCGTRHVATEEETDAVLRRAFAAFAARERRDGG